MELKPRQATILVIDDSAMNVKVLNEVLNKEHRVIFATSGEEGLRAAADELPDLILLDIVMPKMDGYEVCRRLKEDPRTERIPIIFVTALSEHEEEAKGLAAGAVDYLTKPIRQAVVRARVRNHLELKRYQDFLKNLALLDGLTAIANRRSFDQNLDLEWKRARRTGQPLSLLLLDVDFFKKYNDHYGHGAGDDCLREVAGVVQKGAGRPADLAARYGGEEFVCLLPETKNSGAALAGEKIRKWVEELAIPHADSAVAEVVTVSVGVATIISSDEHQAADLLHAADQALYRAKEKGRNRVEIA